MSRLAPQLGVYVHWPYCARICPYCDFNVYKNRDIDAARWAKALTRDLEVWAQKTGERKLESLYFGGGTPSLAPIAVVESVIETCNRLWGFKDGAEITLEANPTDAEQSRFEAFAKAGVNRLSLGVQSFDDEALHFLGRDHSADEARRAIETAKANFSRVSFDLIYARPGQSLVDWRTELKEALAFEPSHLSLYQLTIEPGTAFDKAVAAHRWAPADEDLCADHYLLAQEMTEAAGLPAYEISNHARPGEESRHNLLYWRYQDYVGVGPGAHGRLTQKGERLATETHLKPEDYLAGVERTGSGLSLTDTLDDDAQLVERLSMGLRLREGVTLYADDYFYQSDDRAQRLRQLIEEGFLADNCGRLTATAKGRPVLNALISRLLT